MGFKCEAWFTWCFHDASLLEIPYFRLGIYLFSVLMLYHIVYTMNWEILLVTKCCKLNFQGV